MMVMVPVTVFAVFFSTAGDGGATTTVTHNGTAMSVAIDVDDDGIVSFVLISCLSLLSLAFHTSR